MRPIINPRSGVQSQVLYDDKGNVAKIVETQPKLIFDRAAQLSDDIESNAKPLAGNTQRHMRHVAEIPNAIVNELMRQGIWQDKKRLLKWLDNEGRAFKSYQGRISK